MCDLIKHLRIKIDKLQKDKWRNSIGWLSEEHRWRICLEEMCHMMAMEDDDFHRSYKEIPLEELVFYILQKSIHNDTKMSEFQKYVCVIIEESNNKLEI